LYQKGQLHVTINAVITFILLSQKSELPKAEVVILNNCPATGDLYTYTKIWKSC